MNIPSGTTIDWFASNDGGATWDDAEAFAGLMTRNRREEVEAGWINRELMGAGYQHEDSAATALAAQAGRNQA